MAKKKNHSFFVKQWSTFCDVDRLAMTSSHWNDAWFYNLVPGPNWCVSATTQKSLGIGLDPSWIVSPYRNLVHYQQGSRWHTATLHLSNSPCRCVNSWISLICTDLDSFEGNCIQISSHPSHWYKILIFIVFWMSIGMIPIVEYKLEWFE